MTSRLHIVQDALSLIGHSEVAIIQGDPTAEQADLRIDRLSRLSFSTLEWRFASQSGESCEHDSVVSQYDPGWVIYNRPAEALKVHQIFVEGQRNDTIDLKKVDSRGIHTRDVGDQLLALIGVAIGIEDWLPEFTRYLAAEIAFDMCPKDKPELIREIKAIRDERLRAATFSDAADEGKNRKMFTLSRYTNARGGPIGGGGRGTL